MHMLNVLGEPLLEYCKIKTTNLSLGAPWWPKLEGVMLTACVGQHMDSLWHRCDQWLWYEFVLLSVLPWNWKYWSRSDLKKISLLEKKEFSWKRVYLSCYQKHFFAFTLWENISWIKACAYCLFQFSRIYIVLFTGFWLIINSSKFLGSRPIVEPVNQSIWRKSTVQLSQLV